MKNKYYLTLALGLVTLFFFQMVGTLVESIYILDLLKNELDVKALGLLFLFSPVILLFFRKKYPASFFWIIYGFLVVSRGITPYLDTGGRMVTSGIGIGSVLILLPLVLSGISKSESNSHPSNSISAGIALGTGFSILLRTINYSIDYSLTTEGGWLGWVLGFLLGLFLIQLDFRNFNKPSERRGGVTSATIGLILVLTLGFFLFSAPDVLARWTQVNYGFIVSMVSFIALGWAGIILIRPDIFTNISRLGLFLLNIFFTIALCATILANRVPFPLTVDTPAVVVGIPSWIQQIPLMFTLVLFPVVFLDVLIYSRKIILASHSPSDLAPGLLWGSFSLVLLVFMNIFTNTWGYIQPVSLYFRNKFWLSYLLITLALTILAFLLGRKTETSSVLEPRKISWVWLAFLGCILIFIGYFAFQKQGVERERNDQYSVLLMTYNIQQANDMFGSKSYEKQLALIQQVSPDILALQESDSARISLNNNDYVRYFAGKLGYFSYYGPTPIAGTYGTAILSKFPLENPRTVYSFSDKDEIGTSVVEVDIYGKHFVIFNVHPDGSDTAMMVFAKTLISQAKPYENVISLGDYNLREDELAYQEIDKVFKNAWIDAYPDGISDDGIDMSGRKRIDHIFISPHLQVRNPVYLLAPESATDHPAHWAEIYWSD
jgi:endonuclease/exonuclease/phosphatase family metal-dependent hydrolase